MKGEYVIVRTYDGTPLVRRVWGVSDDEETIYISSDYEYNKLINNLGGLNPVGFPRRDVFQFNETAERLISTGSMSWDKLMHYIPG